MSIRKYASEQYVTENLDWDKLKNRPFDYPTEPEETEIFNCPDAQFIFHPTFEYVTNVDPNIGMTAVSTLPIVGQEYTVYIDENIYENIVCEETELLYTFDISEEISINFRKDLSITNITLDNPDNLTEEDGVRVHSIRIIGYHEGVAKIDEKYLPNTTKYQGDWNINDETDPAFIENRPFYTKDPTYSPVLEETNVTVSATPLGFAGGTIPEDKIIKQIQIGDTYNVIFDGESYTELMPYIYDGGIVLGAQVTKATSGAPSVDFTLYPFVYLDSGGIMTSDTTESTHTISINGKTTEFVKIPHKYLGLNIWNGQGENSIVLNSDITNTATGGSSCAKGHNTTASGYASSAKGYETTASGYASSAKGYETTASGYASSAEGFNTNAVGENQHVQGKYNILDVDENGNALNKYVHIVGNGRAYNNRSNAHTLDWDGNAEYQGDVKANACGGENPISLVETYNLANTQTDWNVNDETASDYLKNKPFYVSEDFEETVFLEETTFNGFSNGKYQEEYISYYQLEDGAEYTVIWDGITYSGLICESGIIGTKDPSFSDYPFAIGMRDILGGTIIVTSDITSTSHTVKILSKKPKIVKLDLKYIPYHTGYGEVFNDYERNIARAPYSHAEGCSTKALGEMSHAENNYTITTIHAKASHAEGWKTQTNSLASHSEGYNTIANGKSQHVQGEYNIEDIAELYERGVYAHIVGNGTSDTNRSNAHTLDWEGNAWFAGSVEGTAIILKSPNGTRFQITVGDDGVLSKTEITA